jgi:uncharacterized membrane protein
MTEAIQTALIGLGGVAIGGAIGIVSPLISSYFEHKKWKKEKKIESLRLKKTTLESKYDKCVKEVYQGIKTKTFSNNIDMLMESIYLLQPNIKKELHKLVEMSQKGDLGSAAIQSQCLFNEMKKSLADIDDEIKKEIDK